MGAGLRCCFRALGNNLVGGERELTDSLVEPCAVTLGGTTDGNKNGSRSTFFGAILVVLL